MTTTARETARMVDPAALNASDSAAVPGARHVIPDDVARLKPAERAALAALAERNGEGVIGLSGALISAGETLPFAPVTFLRLVTIGLVAAAGRYRLALTPAGRRAAGRV